MKKKFSIKLPEIEEKLKSKIITETNIKLIIEVSSKPVSLTNGIIRELTKEEVIQIFMKNKRSGTYDSVKYIDKLYNSDRKK